MGAESVCDPFLLTWSFPGQLFPLGPGQQAEGFTVFEVFRFGCISALCGWGVAERRDRSRRSNPFLGRRSGPCGWAAAAPVRRPARGASPTCTRELVQNCFCTQSFPTPKHTIQSTSRGNLLTLTLIGHCQTLPKVIA